MYPDPNTCSEFAKEIDVPGLDHLGVDLCISPGPIVIGENGALTVNTYNLELVKNGIMPWDGMDPGMQEVCEAIYRGFPDLNINEIISHCQKIINTDGGLFNSTDSLNLMMTPDWHVLVELPDGTHVWKHITVFISGILVELEKIIETQDANAALIGTLIGVVLCAGGAAYSQYKFQFLTKVLGLVSKLRIGKS